MKLSLEIETTGWFEGVRLAVKHGCEDVVEKLVRAVKDGRLPVGPYVADWEFDDDGAVWINTELVIDGVCHGIGANEGTGELFITRGLETDGLDYTQEIRDLNHYWMGFISPLKRVLAIIQ